MPLPSTIEPVAPLVGTMPAACEQDVRALRRFVRSRVSEEALAPAVAPPDFNEVFVTGATGFVGRFLLRDLLRQDESRVVHCLVRATDSDHGLERVRDAMRQAGIWDEGFVPRLRVWTGDLVEPRFGLDSSDFNRLCERIDAVYHVAADVALIAPYVNVRETIITSLRQVLDLCLSVRFKHLFFTSTLGLFPQYFCGFAQEFQDSRIETQMQPDLDSMKRLFPLGLVGYPWGKLTAEQILLHAQRSGLPLAIFRLSQTATSTTGFPKADDLKTRLFAAMVDVGARPSGSAFEWHTEPADVHSKLVVDISLNPQRKFTIYHCCNPGPSYSVGPEEFGFYLHDVPYATFKRLCLARGAASPLHRFWPLLDAFGPYWFSPREPRNEQPISDRAVREDNPNPVQWSGLLPQLRRTDDWMRDHPDQWPHPLPNCALDFDRLMSESERYVQRYGVRSEEAYPHWLLAGLQHLVTALKAPEARLLEAAMTGIVLELSLALRNNAVMAAERSRFPGIGKTEIVQPVFIVGINRTGTTFLHRLLSRDPRFRVLRGFELVNPAPMSTEPDVTLGTPDDVRVKFFNDMVEATSLAKALAGVHFLDPNEPEEDIPLLRMSFNNWLFTVLYHVPDYARWLGDADMSLPYRHHHRGNLQRHAYRDRIWHGRQSQWLLKMPFHLMELDALVQTYPDALFIQTHRIPRQFMGSWNSLVERGRSLSMEPMPLHKQGREQLALLSGMMDKAVDFRLAHPELEHQWLDLSYYDLVQDPMGMVEVLYDHFGWNLNPSAAAAMDDWLIRQSRRRRRERRHRYDLARYGLTPDEVDNAFARYRDFIVDNGINEPRV